MGVFPVQWGSAVEVMDAVGLHATAGRLALLAIAPFGGPVAEDPAWRATAATLEVPPSPAPRARRWRGGWTCLWMGRKVYM